MTKGRVILPNGEYFARAANNSAGKATRQHHAIQKSYTVFRMFPNMFTSRFPGEFFSFVRFYWCTRVSFALCFESSAVTFEIIRIWT